MSLCFGRLFRCASCRLGTFRIILQCTTVPLRAGTGPVELASRGRGCYCLDSLLPMSVFHCRSSQPISCHRFGAPMLTETRWVPFSLASRALCCRNFLCQGWFAPNQSTMEPPVRAVRTALAAWTGGAEPLEEGRSIRSGARSAHPGASAPCTCEYKICRRLPLTAATHSRLRADPATPGSVALVLQLGSRTCPKPA